MSNGNRDVLRAPAFYQRSEMRTVSSSEIGDAVLLKQAKADKVYEAKVA